MRSSIIALRSQRADRGQHPGLLLQRYLCEHATGDAGNPEEKRAILQAAINAAMNEDVRALYRIAFNRWSASLSRGPVPVDLATVGRLIVGLGSENVLETGIRLHHTYGIPIIPGSALKGLAAHYSDQVWALSDQRFKKPTKQDDEAYRKFVAGTGPQPEDNFHRLLFGSTDDSGCIIFHDSWLTPDSPKPLLLDVMTPHHPKWLNGSAPPTDFDSPIPVPFLSVSGTFRVAVSWHGPEHKEAESWTSRSLELLRDALMDWGIGGKTSSGYGRLGVPDTPQPRLAVSTVVQTRTPIVPQPGVSVEAMLLEEKTKKGGWKAKHDSSGLDGPVQNSGDVPGEKKPGDTLILIVASANERESAFRYPTAADEQRAQKVIDKTNLGRGGQQPRGRR